MYLWIVAFLSIWVLKLSEKNSAKTMAFSTIVNWRKVSKGRFLASRRWGFKQSFDDFHAHSSVMIWTFPESSLVILSVDGTIGTDTPEPFPVIFVNKIFLDVFPASKGFLKCFLVSKMLP